MSSETIREVSSEDMVSIGKIRFISFTSGIVEFLYLLGLGMLLLLKWDYIIILWFFLNKLAQSWIKGSLTRHSQQLKGSFMNLLGRQTGANYTSLPGKVKGSVLNISAVVVSLLLLWIFSLLKNPAKYSTGATLLLVAAVIQVIAVLIRYLIEPQLRTLLNGLFMPLNVLLWYLAIVHRNGLVLMFGVESIIVLMFTIVGWFRFKPEQVINPKFGILGKLSKDLKNIDMDKINKNLSAISPAVHQFVVTRYGSPISHQYSHTTNNKGVKVTTEIRYKFSPEVLDEHPDLEQEIRDFLQEKFPQEYAELQVLDVHWQGVILDDDDEED